MYMGFTFTDSSQASKAWFGSVGVVDSGEVISTGQVGGIYWS